MRVQHAMLQNRAKKSTKTNVLGKMHALELIGTPLITEKAYKQVESMNTYWFRIDKAANKNDVKAALQTIYKVEPLSVRVINVVSKGRLNRKLVRRAYKKAIVTLKKGDKIELAA